MMLCLLVTANVYGSDAGDRARSINVSGLPSITGLLRSYSLMNPERRVERWISLSPVGMRITDPDRQISLLKNFQKKTVWMISGRKKQRHRLDFSLLIETYPEAEQDVFGSAGRSNVIGQQACSVGRGVFEGKRVWRGHVVEKWQCLDEAEMNVSTQLFSPEWGLVVRVVKPDDTVDELVSIRHRAFGATEFEPSPGYRDVGFAQFTGGRPVIGRYAN